MYRIKRTIYYFFLVLTVVIAGQVHAANIIVLKDIDPIAFGESFQLIFEAKGSVDDDPDFSPLKKDFQILSTSVNTSMKIINSKISRTKRWELTLLANRTGNLIIPAIRFGNDISDATSIIVTKNISKRNSQNTNKNIFLEVDARPLSAYVQSQVKYIVRLFRSVDTSNASLSVPEVDASNAIIEQLGEDRSYETRRNGKRFIVVERTYAIYPQISGKIVIKPVRFQGQISSRRSFFTLDPFGPQPKTVVLQSAPVTLNVIPTPESYIGTWLPTKQLTFTEEWSKNPPVFRAGEPITRTLILSATGLTASQLPEFPTWQMPEFRQYPDQPSLGDENVGLDVVAKRIEKTAIIPKQAGKYILPGIEIPWWNITTNSIEHALIPERKITVLAAVTNAALDAPGIVTALPDITDSSILPVDKDNQLKLSAGPIKDMPEQITSRYWQWISIGLGCGWFITLVIWWYSRNRVSKSVTDQGKLESISRVIKELKKACQDNEPFTAKDILIRWGSLKWPQDPPTSLGEIGKRSSPEFSPALSMLSNSLYSKKTDAWSGDRFWQVFSEQQKNERSRSVPDAGNLEPLYRL